MFFSITMAEKRTPPIFTLTTKMQTTKFSSANFQNILSPSYIILRIQRLEQCISSVYLDEVAHDEPPHLDLRCLLIQLFSSLVLKELTYCLKYSNSSVDI